MSAQSEFSSTTTASIIVLCIIFGANPVAVKISLAGFGPFTNAGIRFSFAVVVIFCWAIMTRQSLRIEKHLWPSVIVVGLILLMQISLFYIGMNKTSASHGALIANLLPFMVLILSHFFIPGDRITPRRAMGMALGFLGIFLILTDKKGIQSGFQTGDLILLAAVFMWACRVVFAKRVIHDFEPYHLVIYPFLLASPFFLIGGMLFDPEMVIRLDPSIIGALVFQILAIASLGFVAWHALLKKYGASSLHSFVFVTPVAGVFFGWMILGDPLTPHLLMSLALVTAGLVVFHLKWPVSV